MQGWIVTFNANKGGRIEADPSSALLQNVIGSSCGAAATKI